MARSSTLRPGSAARARRGRSRASACGAGTSQPLGGSGVELRPDLADRFRHRPAQRWRRRTLAAPRRPGARRPESPAGACRPTAAPRSPSERARSARRVGWRGAREELPRSAPALDDTAGIHDRDPSGTCSATTAEIVADEQDRHAPSPLRSSAIRSMICGLHRDVERRRWLVGDQQLGAAGERHGDHRPAGAMPPDSWCGKSLMRRSGDGTWT